MQSTLNEIILYNNGFIGCLPAEIGSLSEVTAFDASFNSFPGVLPDTFAGLKKLESLNIAHDLLTGMVPGSVCGIKSLGNFQLYRITSSKGQPQSAHQDRTWYLMTRATVFWRGGSRNQERLVLRC